MLITDVRVNNAWYRVYDDHIVSYKVIIICFRPMQSYSLWKHDLSQAFLLHCQRSTNSHGKYICMYMYMYVISIPIPTRLRESDQWSANSIYRLTFFAAWRTSPSDHVMDHSLILAFPLKTTGSNLLGIWGQGISDEWNKATRFMRLNLSRCRRLVCNKQDGIFTCNPVYTETFVVSTNR
jgi:hypothetical protein